MEYAVEVVIHDGSGDIAVDVMLDVKTGKIDKTCGDYDADLLLAALKGAQATAGELGAQA